MSTSQGCTQGRQAKETQHHNNDLLNSCHSTPCLFAEREGCRFLNGVRPSWGTCYLVPNVCGVVASQDDDVAGARLDPFADLRAEKVIG